MPTGPFDASQFIATEWSSAADKAAFGNSFLRFIEGDWKESLFTKNFYNRLSMCFGHIAHYDRTGFWDTWFTSDRSRFEFLCHALKWPCYGDPKFTFCDVERAIQREIRRRNYLAIYELKSAEELRSAEMAVLSHLEAKYRTHAPAPDVSEPLEQQVSADATSLLREPVQGSLF
jgi:hypothetical protein